MPSRLFVLTGCARSGLRFTSQSLNALGAPCGHEDVLSLESFERSGTLFWPSRLAGDASWLAAPVLGKLPERSVIFHQVRHPLSTVQRVLSSTPGKARSRPESAADWDRLPAGNLRDEMMAVASRYGYDESVKLGVGA